MRVFGIGRRLPVALACLAVLFGLGGVAQPPASLAEVQILRIAHLEVDLRGLDPHLQGTASADTPILRMVYNGLVRYPVGTLDYGAIEGDLATHWKTNEDGLVWVFYLREGVTFHRGFGEVTSDDVVFSYGRLKDQRSPWRADFTNIVRVEATDRYVVTFHLQVPDSAFLLRVLDYRAWIVSRAAVEEGGVNLTYEPVGTGPFELVEYLPRERVTLARFPDYFRGAAILEKVVYHFMPDLGSREMALRRGDVDMIYGDNDLNWLTMMERDPMVTVFTVLPGLPYFLYLNTSVAPLDSLDVRRALHHATDKEAFGYVFEVVQTLVSPVAPGYLGYTEDVPVYEYDVAKARALLAQAGYPNGITLKHITSNMGTYPILATILQAQWAEAGIRLEITLVDHAAWHTQIRQNLSMVVAYSFTRLPLADPVLSQFFHSSAIVGTPTAVTNFAHYRAVDDLIERARFALGLDEKLALYAEAQRKIMEDAVCVPLYLQGWPPFVAKTYVDFAQPMPPATLIYFPTIHEGTRLLEH